jgi:hypothetical protein
MDLKGLKLTKECVGIINQLYDLAEVPVEKRQAINDEADKYLLDQVLRLSAVSKSVCDHSLMNTGLSVQGKSLMVCTKCRETKQ